MEETMKGLVFKIKWHLYKPNVISAYRELMKTQYLSLDEILRNDELARRRIVEHAFLRTKFYNDLYSQHGFALADIGTDGWFEKLPIVTKAHLQSRFEDFFDTRQRDWATISTTGGSTGVPTRTGHDRRLPVEAWSWRFLNWHGVTPWDDHAYVWRMRQTSLKNRFVNALLWWPTRHLKMDASCMRGDDICVFIRKYNELKPTLLQGYVGAIAQVAQYVLDNRLKVHTPKCVWTTSAPLGEVQRNLIVTAFRAPILDQYGSCEVDSIAQSCPICKGLHVNSEFVHVEYVDSHKRVVDVGSFGSALLTNLMDTVFPIIRYENGDRGRYLDGCCSCGRNLPLIDSVKGRVSESFTLPSGRILSGEYLTTIFDSNPGVVKGFRVIQNKDYSITIEYIPNAADDSVKDTIRQFLNIVNGEVPVNLKVIKEIPHDRGKTRFVIRI